MQTTIERVNETILRVFKRVANVQLYGLAESVAARDKDSDRVIPAIVFPDGECYDVYGMADMKDVTIYHRLQSAQFQQIQSYGSRKEYNKENDLSMVVYGKRAAYNQYELADAICGAIGSLPEVTLSGVDHNLLQVFASEYNGLSCFLNPDYFLLRINYRLTSTHGCKKNDKL